MSSSKTYDTGKPCKYGHMAPRFVANRTCVECNKIREQQRTEYNKSWRKNNKERHLAKKMEYRIAHPWKNRMSKAKYRAKLLKATPTWADFKAISEIYEESARLTEETGILHNVDHDIPLQGEFVSGLHCETNLVILEAVDNLSKGNKYEF